MWPFQAVRPPVLEAPLQTPRDPVPLRHKAGLLALHVPTLPATAPGHPHPQHVCCVFDKDDIWEIPVISPETSEYIKKNIDENAELEP